MIPFLDIRRINERHGPALAAALNDVMGRGQFILGPCLTSFENAFARYCERDHCVGVGNGLDALVLCLRAYDIGPGDEVIVPSNTFIATWLAVTMVGATIVPVEPDPYSYNIDPAAVAAAINPRTKAVIAVHLYGQPADVQALRSLTKGLDIKIIEDAAQAHGSRAHGRRAGSLGDAAAFSFYPGKNLGALGDGGAVVSNDAEFIETVRALANYGSRTKYVHSIIGQNTRLDEVQAAFLGVKLPFLDHDNAARRQVAQRYLEGLQGTGLTLPYVAPWAESVWHLFVVQHPRRDEIARILRSQGIETGVHYPTPPHLQGCYSEVFKNSRFGISEDIHRHVLSLPISPVMDPEDVEAVITQVRRATQSLM